MEALDDLSAITGIIGAFMVDGKKGVLLSEAPEFFDAENLPQVGRLLAKIFGASRLASPNTRDIAFYYSEMLLVARELKPSVYLVVACNPTMNLALLTTSLNLAMDDFMAGLDAPPPAPRVFETFRPQRPEPEPPAPEAVEVKQQPAEKWTLERVRNTREFAATIDHIEHSLAKVIGPMARIVLNDSIDFWISSATPQIQKIGELVDLIAKDIGNEAKAEKFRALVNERPLV